MNSERIIQNIFYLMAAIVIFALLYAFKPSYPFQPKGIVLPGNHSISQTRGADANSQPVTVYYSTFNVPLNYTALAQIHVEGHTLEPTKTEQEQMVLYAQKLAKKAGGTGLIINALGYEGPGLGNPAPLAKMVLLGEAIK